MPYSTAATCLHMFAQSGQLHSSVISRGLGNKPVSGSVTIAITSSESEPRSNSSTEPMRPEQRILIASQTAAGNRLIRTVTT